MGVDRGTQPLSLAAGSRHGEKVFRREDTQEHLPAAWLRALSSPPSLHLLLMVRQQQGTEEHSQERTYSPCHREEVHRYLHVHTHTITHMEGSAQPVCAHTCACLHTSNHGRTTASGACPALLSPQQASQGASRQR